MSSIQIPHAVNVALQQPHIEEIISICRAYDKDAAFAAKETGISYGLMKDIYEYLDDLECAQRETAGV